MLPHLVLPMTTEPPKLWLSIVARFLNLRTPCFRLNCLLAFLVLYILTPSWVKLMTCLATTICCFPLILNSISVLSGRGGGWLGLCFPLVQRILHLYTRLLKLAGSHKCLLEFRVVCSLNTDDRLNRELFALQGFWSCPLLQRTVEYSYQSAGVIL